MSKKLQRTTNLSELTPLKKKRSNSESRFKLMGKLSLLVALFFLTILFFRILSGGLSAFNKTIIAFEVNTIGLEKGSTTPVKDAYKEYFKIEKAKTFFKLVSRNSKNEIELNKPQHLAWVSASSDVDMYLKGKLPKNSTRITQEVKDKIKQLKDDKRLKAVFNWSFFKNATSRKPEKAGILGALVGTLFSIFICMLAAFPIAVGAAIYLEEIAKKNRFTDFLEVIINNLAAVPSIVYGLLGLYIFLGETGNVLGLTRSSALVGGLTLAILVMPTIIISARSALKSVQPSIKQAAIGLGASKMQVLLHHTLPISFSGIMTGAILAIARALGETAPLLMVGMVAFVPSIASGINEATTSLPVQIYLWADAPEMGFQEKTSAAIIVLIVFLVILNGIASYIRKRSAV